jgi:hypothetical protein
VPSFEAGEVPRRSTSSLEFMGTRHRQFGYWHILSALVGVLVVMDVLLTLTRTFRRRRVADASGALSVEAPSVYWGRLARSLGLHIFAWAVLAGTFWAIVCFGPLRPVHEWFR